MFNIDPNNGYWNMSMYPNQFPVSHPTVYLVFHRADNYNPPVGLHLESGEREYPLIIKPHYI